MKIKSIKPIDYNEDVYNLRIKSDNGLNHNYFANGLNVSNCHRATANSIKTILEKALNADRVFGLTGTVPKKGTLDRLTICAYTGPIITSIRADFLIEQGYITKCEVLALEMNYVSNEVRTGFANLFNRSSEDRKKLLSLEQNYAINSAVRLDFITDFILKNNKNCLVLFHRIDYGNRLFDMLRQKSDRKVLYIDGGVDKERRSHYKEVLEEDNIKTKIILEFNNIKFKFNEDEKILLSDGSYKEAKHITINDDVSDKFLFENKNKIIK